MMRLEEIKAEIIECGGLNEEQREIRRSWRQTLAICERLDTIATLLKPEVDERPLAVAERERARARRG